MGTLNKVIRSLRALFGKQRLEEELDEELRFHLEKEMEQNLARGMSPEEARRAALVSFGGVEPVKEECRDAWGVRFIETLIQDLRFGLRQLRRSPGFTAVAVITLALGIGANTAIFSVVNAVLLRPLPYPRPEELVHLGSSSAGGVALSAPEFLFFRDHAERAFEGIGAAFQGPDSTMAFQRGAEVQYISGMHVSEDLFRVLGVSPWRGRSFLAEEDRPGGPHAAILSYGFWQSHFATDPNLLGEHIVLDHQDYTVVGVLPASFQSLWPADVWVPLQLTFDPLDTGHNFKVIGRLKVDIPQGRAEVGRVFELQRRQYPKSAYPDESILVIPYQQWLVGDVRTPLLVLLGAVAFVLLIACLNIASLLLARGTGRLKEIALRASLGASRRRLVRQLLTETIPLPFLGGALGILVALWSMTALRAAAPEDIPLVNQVRIDGWVLCFTLGLAVLAGIVSGLIPALQVAWPRLYEALKEGARGQTPGVTRHRTRSMLVVAEVGLSTILLTGAGLLVLSLVKLVRVNPGFDFANLWVARLILPTNQRQTTAMASAFEEHVLERLRTLPGVTSVAFASTAPVADQFNFPVDIHGQEEGALQYRAISPGYFRTLGIPLLSGRPFLENDRRGTPGVAIINHALARKYWADRSPVGDVITAGKGMPAKYVEPPRQIVGVVADTKVWLGVPVSDQPMVYVPHEQVPDGLTAEWLGSPVWVIKSTAPVNLHEVESKVHDVDPTQPVWRVESVRQMIRASAQYQQFLTVLLGSFAALALILAATGLYGVVSYSVTQRVHEIGVRMALGAARRDVLRLVVGQGMALALIGVGIGLAAAFGFSRFVSSLLFEVKPSDPATYTTVSLVLSAVTLLASYLPARRATKVDPMVALRYE